MHLPIRDRFAIRARLIAVTAVLAAAPFVVAAPADETPTIRTIAPVKSFLLFSMDDVRGTVERFRKTPLHELWESETVQSAVAEEWKEFKEGMSKRLQELGLPEDTLSWPVSIGVAAFLERNEELDTSEPMFVAIADWGDGADKMAAFFDASFAEAAKESPDRIETKEIRGRKATIFTPELPESEPDPGMGGMPTNPLPGLKKLVFVRDGQRFLVAGGTYAMEDALTAVDVPPSKLVTDEEDARGALQQLGSGDMVAILRTAPLAPMVDQMAMGPAALILPMLGQLFGDIQAYGFSATVDGPVGMVDSAITIYTPGGRKGLLSLMEPAPISPAPAIVPQDAIGYGHMNVGFKQVMEIVEGVVAGLPEAVAEEVDASLQMYGPTLKKALAVLGPDVHVYTTVTQPISPESESNTVAIACSDEQAVIPLINMFAPMLGFESRDFVGQTIFSAPGVPMSIGFGGGHMVLGATANVEQALRSSSGEGKGSASARTGAEQSAMALLPAQPMVGWGWYDTVAGLEVARQIALAQGASGEGEIMDFIDEQGKVVKEVIGVEMPSKMLDALRTMDSEFLSKYVGPQLWQFSADSKGLAYRLSLLRPKAKPAADAR